ncbi:MAG: copper chaperone PCu(A)C [Pseudomonadota bacterium]
MGDAEITNGGSTDDQLLSASSPAFGKIELHRSEKDGDIMRMVRMETIPVPAGETVTLEPGGLHTMLFDATQLFKEGARFEMELVFEKAGTVTLDVPVKRKAGGGHGEHGNHGSHSGHGTTN